MPTTADVRIRSTRPLISPAIREDELPLSDAAAARVHEARRAIARVVTGEDDRLLAIVGPCSVHDPVAARDAQVIRADYAKWGRVVKASGARVD